MTEQVKRDTQAVTEAVIGGTAVNLASALSRLSSSSPTGFRHTTERLLDTRQPETVSTFGLGFGDNNADRCFYHADGHVFGATYTEGHWFMTKRAHPAGVGIPYEAVKEVVIKVRTEYDESVLKKALQLKESLSELDKLLTGHSFADRKLTNMAHDDLFKGHALLVAALNPVRR